MCCRFYSFVFIFLCFDMPLSAFATVFRSENSNKPVIQKDSHIPSGLTRYEKCQSKVRSLDLKMDKLRKNLQPPVANTSQHKAGRVCGKLGTVEEYEFCLHRLSENLEELKKLKTTMLSLIQNDPPCPHDFTSTALKNMESMQKTILSLEEKTKTFKQTHQEIKQGASGKKYVQWRLQKCLKDIKTAAEHMEEQAGRYNKNNVYFLHQYLKVFDAHENYILLTKDQCLNVATQTEDRESYQKTLRQIHSQVQSFQKQKDQVFQNKNRLLRQAANKMCQQLENINKTHFHLICNSKKVQNVSWSYTLHYFLQKNMCDRDDVVDFTCYPPPYLSL